MDIMTGIVIIVAILAVIAFLVALIVLSDRVDTPEPPPRPTWTSVTTYGPSCAVVRLEGDDAVKVCVREANHDGDHQYKIIKLGGLEKNGEELS